MSTEKNWQFELEEYMKQGEPGQIEKSEAWQTAIGLQAVDGLQTSAYLIGTAKEHIEGKITIEQAEERIQSYYEQLSERVELENDTMEADIVSARIAKLLGEKTFQFSPAEWLTIHRRLFENVFPHAGQIRQYNITKKEWVLKGDSVKIYSDLYYGAPGVEVAVTPGTEIDLITAYSFSNGVSGSTIKEYALMCVGS